MRASLVVKRQAMADAAPFPSMPRPTWSCAGGTPCGKRRLVPKLPTAPASIRQFIRDGPLVCGRGGTIPIGPVEAHEGGVIATEHPDELNVVRAIHGRFSRFGATTRGWHVWPISRGDATHWSSQGTISAAPLVSPHGTSHNRLDDMMALRPTCHAMATAHPLPEQERQALNATVSAATRRS